MKQAIPWLITAITLVGIYEQGNKRWRGWAIGLGNQALWITMAIWFQTWGLLPLSGALILLYSRNLFRWRKEDSEVDARPPCPVRWDPDLGAWVHNGGYRGTDRPADTPVTS